MAIAGCGPTKKFNYLEENKPQSAMEARFIHAKQFGRMHKQKANTA
jgi:hypothetical protein